MSVDFEKSIKRWHRISVWWPTYTLVATLVVLAALNLMKVAPGSILCAVKADCVNQMASEVFFLIFNPAMLFVLAFLIAVQIFTLTKSADLHEAVVRGVEAWWDWRSRD